MDLTLLERDSAVGARRAQYSTGKEVCKRNIPWALTGTPLHESEKLKGNCCDKIFKMSQTSGTHQSQPLTDAMKAQVTNLLMEAVSKCSRQKMRFILMQIRRASGVDSYMSYGDLARLLQDHGIAIPPTATPMIESSCSDHMGVDAEKVWKLLMDVHSESGRDSVRARKGLHLRTPMISVFGEIGGDRELSEKVQTQLLAAAESTFEFKAFKAAVLDLDRNHKGYVPNTQLVRICREHAFPVSGEVLKALLIRCDDDNNGKISHREFFIFLEKSLNNALKINPKLFAKKEDEKNKKRTEAGRILDDGSVTVNEKARANLSSKNSGESSSLGLKSGDGADEIGGPVRTASSSDLNDLDQAEGKNRKGSMVSNAALVEEGKSKSSKRVGKVIGLLSRKKGSSSTLTAESSAGDANSDRGSIASSSYSAVSRAANAFSRELSSNGLTEKAIHPVVRKVNEHKMILWPPDEYFDSVTPKIRRPILEWTYGYNGFSNRSNVIVTKNTEGKDVLVYTAGQTVVLLDLENSAERFYIEHDGPIECIAATPDKKMIASGQGGYKEEANKAVIRLWSPETLETLRVLRLENSDIPNAIAAVTFSKDSDCIIGIDSQKMRNIHVWNLEQEQLLVSKPFSESQTVCGIHLLQGINKEHQYLIYGRNLMEIWRVVPIEKKVDFLRHCVFGQVPKPPIITCVTEAFVSGSLSPLVISGDSDGNVILWSEEMRPKVIMLTGNKVPIFALWSISPTEIVAGSRDGTVLVLTLKGKTAVVSHKTRIPEQYGGIRTIVPLVPRDSEKTNLIIGCTANALLHWSSPLEPNVLDVEKATIVPLSIGHFDDNSGCLAVTNIEGRTLALTAGMDGNINCYDLQSHAVVWRIFLRDLKVASLDAAAQRFAVGTTDSKMIMYAVTEGNPEPVQLFQVKIGSGKVSVVKFSPDGSRIAAGSSDSEIYVYQLPEDDLKLTPIGRFDKHDYPVMCIDWSKNPARDNHFVIHSNSERFENFLFDAETMDFLEEAHFYRNVRWASQSCVLGFPALASLPNDAEGQVVCTDVSPTLDLVAVVAANQKSQLSIRSYPNATAQTLHHLQPTASSDISAVKFCYVNNQLYLLCAHESGNLTQWLLQ